MKKFRKVYENIISRNENKVGFIPTELEFLKFEQNITIEIKEADGCKVEFVLLNDKLIGALCTDDELDMENTKLDIDNYTSAYTNFNIWLND